MGSKIKYSTLGNMKSIITDDTKRCINCGMPATHCHHCFEGPDKPLSEKYELMIPMCAWCHYQLHQNQEMNLHYKRLGQEAFERKYPGEQFNKIFRKSYL